MTTLQRSASVNGACLGCSVYDFSVEFRHPSVPRRPERRQICGPGRLRYQYGPQLVVRRRVDGRPSHRFGPVRLRPPLRRRGGSSKIAGMDYTPYMPRFPAIREPGLPAFELGTERYKVSGGGAILVPILQGERITIVDREGRQRCEIAAFAADGREDRGALRLKPGTSSAGISGLLAGESEDARKIAAALRRRGLPRRVDKAAHLFEGDSRPGEAAELIAQRDCIAIFHAPGGPMRADAQDAPTDLSVIIKRAVAPNIVAPPLPEPLADPREEIRIDRCTARGYLV